MYKIGYFPRPTVESNVELPLWLDDLREDVQGDGTPAKPGVVKDLEGLDIYIRGDGTPGSKAALDERVEALIRGTGLYRVVREYYSNRVLDDNDWQSFLILSSGMPNPGYDVYVFAPSENLTVGSMRNKWIPEIVSNTHLVHGAIEMPLWNLNSGSNVQLVWQPTEGSYITRIHGRDANGNTIDVMGGSSGYIAQLPLHRRALLTYWGGGVYSFWVL